jgi:hypothetical protein
MEPGWRASLGRFRQILPGWRHYFKELFKTVASRHKYGDTLPPKKQFSVAFRAINLLFFPFTMVAALLEKVEIWRRFARKRNSASILL